MEQGAPGQSHADLLPLFEHIEAEAGRLSVRVAEPLRRGFARSDFWVEYPAEIDLTSLPRSIQLLPAVYAIAPLAWAAGGRYFLEGVDERTTAALGLLRSELKRVNPGASLSGEVVALSPVPVATPPDSRAAAGLLFSTGVDSTSTAIQHRAEALVLISVGLDDDLPEARWRADMAEAGLTQRSSRR